MSQESSILKALQKGQKLTQLDAISLWNCYRLGARCFDLRQKGHKIKTEMVTSSSGRHFARYSLK